MKRAFLELPYLARETELEVLKLPAKRKLPFLRCVDKTFDQVTFPQPRHLARRALVDCIFGLTVCWAGRSKVVLYKYRSTVIDLLTIGRKSAYMPGDLHY